jgi:hypothetical protein
MRKQAIKRKLDTENKVGGETENKERCKNK